MGVNRHFIISPTEPLFCVISIFMLCQFFRGKCRNLGLRGRLYTYRYLTVEKLETIGRGAWLHWTACKFPAVGSFVNRQIGDALSQTVGPAPSGATDRLSEDVGISRAIGQAEPPGHRRLGQWGLRNSSLCGFSPESRVPTGPTLPCLTLEPASMVPPWNSWIRQCICGELFKCNLLKISHLFSCFWRPERPPAAVLVCTWHQMPMPFGLMALSNVTLSFHWLHYTRCAQKTEL